MKPAMYGRSRDIPRRNRLDPQDKDQVRKHRPDYWLLILMIALLSVGVIVVYSISPALAQAHNMSSNYYVAREAIAIGLGAVVFLIASRIPISVWRKLCPALLVAAGVVTLIALITPIDPDYPARRWVRLGGFSFQSVELLKFALLMWLAGILGMRVQDGSIGNGSGALKILLLVLLGVGVIVAGIQSDLGSMAVIIAMLSMMAFVAGLPMRRLVLVGLAILVLVTAAVASTPYRRDRLSTYLNPAADCQNSGYQACQALISVGSGGMAGLGLGRSVQAYGYLPEAANDSIFAIYAEKFGFIGVTTLLGIFLAFFWRIKRIAERTQDATSRLIVMGILAWLATQTIINIGAMLGLLPLKGITLPLVSYGGTSVVFIMAALGVVFHISKHTTYAVQTGEDTPRRAGNTINRRSLERRRQAGGGLA